MEKNVFGSAMFVVEKSLSSNILCMNCADLANSIELIPQLLLFVVAR
jgi:hypothetical protein